MEKRTIFSNCQTNSFYFDKDKIPKKLIVPYNITPKNFSSKSP